MYLKRGPIMLAASGAIALIIFSMLGYYSLHFVNVIQNEGKYIIEPHDSINMRQNINNTQGIGMYVVDFAEFGGQASVIIMDYTGKIIIDKNLHPPITIETFNVEVPGLYNLTLSNPTDRAIEVAMIFGDWEYVLGRKNLFSAMTVLIFVFLLVICIAVAIAGTIITILDRRRVKRMKQLGDTSDLI
jgi:hypothetical protein